MSGNAREIKDVFYLVALQGINYVMPLVVFPYLMAVLGAEKFGYIGFSTALIQFFMLIVDFGFNFTATKEVALHKDNPQLLRNIFWNTLTAKTGLLTASFIIFTLLMYAVPRFSVYRSTAFIFFLMVVGNTFSFVWYFQGLGKIRLVSIANIISKLLILPLIFWFVKTPNDYLKAAFIQASVYLFSALLTTGILVLGKMLPAYQKPAWEQIQNGLRSAFPVFLSMVASSLYVALFAVILGFFSTPSEVGKYTAAEKIMRGFSFLIFIPIVQAFYPKLSAISYSAKIESQHLVKKIALIVSCIMFIVFILLFFFSDYIIHFLGKDYNGINIIFRIMAFIPFFIALGGVFGQLGLLALGDEQDKLHYQNTYLIAGIVAIIAILIFAPLFEAIGATIALAITEITVFYNMYYWYKKLTKKEL